MGLENIDHFVVVMMENRSLDNLLGWLYEDPKGQPSAVIPASSPPDFDGLKPDTYYNQLAGDGSPKVYASRPPTSWPPVCPQPSQVPTPDPQEEFEFVTKQLFGDKLPVTGELPDMSGFLKDYATTKAGAASAGQIMESFGPSEAGVINTLARNFAVSDRWYASAPTQTWPNRGFVHTGSSDGHINNDDYEPYGNQTIFSVLEQQGKSWRVFHDTTFVPSLTHIQFAELWPPPLDGNFRRFNEFRRCCAAARPEDRLPAYSFVEPRFVPEPGEWWRLFRTRYPSDYHPPHDVLRGEQFLAEVYGAVRSSPYRDRILLVITFDEHGGCYDHSPPPWGSVAPKPGAVSRTGDFTFNRFGVRVPTIVISSYVTPGSVFRADPEKTPYDHASILATLRDWLKLDPARFLPSPRIINAPTLERVLGLDPAGGTADWPSITAASRIWWKDTSRDIPLNDVQKSLMAHMKRRDSATPGDRNMTQHAAFAKANMLTIGHALDYIKSRP